VLPRTGGKLAQEPRFIDGVEVLDAEVLRMRARRAAKKAKDGKE